jgi:hypothetical protein
MTVQRTDLITIHNNIQEHEVSEQHKAATNFAERPEAEVKKSEGARCVHM